MPNPQHIAALAQANHVRLRRAEIRSDLHDGRTTMASLILDPPPELDTVTVFTVLAWQHRWGRRVTLRFLASLPDGTTAGVRVSEHRRLGELTRRERLLIASRLTGVVDDRKAA